MGMRQGVCPECGHEEIIEAIPLEFSRHGSHARMRVSYSKRLVVPRKNPHRGQGALVTYTCRSCGLTQWFATHPEDIPIGEEHGTRLFDPSTAPGRESVGSWTCGRCGEVISATFSDCWNCAEDTGDENEAAP